MKYMKKLGSGYFFPHDNEHTRLFYSATVKSIMLKRGKSTNITFTVTEDLPHGMRAKSNAQRFSLKAYSLAKVLKKVRDKNRFQNIKKYERKITG